MIAAYGNPLKRDYFSLSPLGKFVQVVKTSDGLTRKIQFLIKNKNFSEDKIEKAFIFAKDQGWEKIAETYSDIYQKF